MAWGSKVDATQLTNITTEQFFSATPTLADGGLAHCEVEFNPPTTPTDDLIVAVYGTLDDSSENWDDDPILEFQIPNSPDPCKRSFTVFGVYKFRVGVRRSGATDTITSADFSYRLSGQS